MLYKIDTGLLAELRAHEQQAAQELSQWQTKTVLLAWGRTEAGYATNAGVLAPTLCGGRIIFG
jgi:hypothetical protein